MLSNTCKFFIFALVLSASHIQAVYIPSEDSDTSGWNNTNWTNFMRNTNEMRVIYEVREGNITLEKGQNVKSYIESIAKHQYGCELMYVPNVLFELAALFAITKDVMNALSKSVEPPHGERISTKKLRENTEIFKHIPPYEGLSDSLRCLTSYYQLKNSKIFHSITNTTREFIEENATEMPFLGEWFKETTDILNKTLNLTKIHENLISTIEYLNKDKKHLPNFKKASYYNIYENYGNDSNDFFEKIVWNIVNNLNISDLDTYKSILNEEINAYLNDKVVFYRGANLYPDPFYSQPFIKIAGTHHTLSVSWLKRAGSGLSSVFLENDSNVLFIKQATNYAYKKIVNFWDLIGSKKMNSLSFNICFHGSILTDPYLKRVSIGACPLHYYQLKKKRISYQFSSEEVLGQESILWISPLSILERLLAVGSEGHERTRLPVTTKTGQFAGFPIPNYPKEWIRNDFFLDISKQEWEKKFTTTISKENLVTF